MLANAVVIILWVGVTCYALFGGADLGAGLWDLFAGDAVSGRELRHRIERSMGPLWEANHVWLIFSLVVLWTAFPTVFAAVASTLYMPFTIAAFGIIARGSAFAFRKEVEEVEAKRLFGAAFALSSVITPFAFGTIAGAVASQRVPAGIAQGDVIRSWINPTSLLGGVISVMVAAYLAAVYLTADARRHGQDGLAEQFRHRALGMGLAIAVVGVAGAFVLRADAPVLFGGLTGTALPVLLVSAAAGVASLVLLERRAYVVVRGTAALAVAAGLWAWGVAQYPLFLPPAVTVASAAAAPAILSVVAIGLGIGAVLIVPSLVLLFTLFQSVEPGRNPGSP